LGDCWITDKNGNIHPGYNVSPVPVSIESVGKREHIPAYPFNAAKRTVEKFFREVSRGAK
jgi:hypothetical protein